jgi:Arc/MetJ-type ribon-helix-helix transcriptional regulator
LSESVEMAKVRLQVTVREDIVKWIDKQVETLRFASRSHAIEYALGELMKQEKKE